MGTLSKNFDQFGRRLGSRVGHLKTNASHPFDDLGDKVDSTSAEEGALTHAIERVTSALPSSMWLALAGVAIAGSLGLRIARRERIASFIGELAPTFLLLGVYNRLVKLHGSER